MTDTQTAINGTQVETSAEAQIPQPRTRNCSKSIALLPLLRFHFHASRADRCQRFPKPHLTGNHCLQTLRSICALFIFWRMARLLHCSSRRENAVWHPGRRESIDQASGSSWREMVRACVRLSVFVCVIAECRVFLQHGSTSVVAD